MQLQFLALTCLKDTSLFSLSLSLYLVLLHFLVFLFSVIIVMSFIHSFSSPIPPSLPPPPSHKYAKALLVCFSYFAATAVATAGVLLLFRFLVRDARTSTTNPTFPMMSTACVNEALSEVDS